ncbi:MAG: flagellar biosynthetic protein FliO, partial [Candidatus Eisenbacteria bacterium]|nr:flagellar biosynthetic protein FliO [Candidatus Eisenbacteria bacterium]
MMGSWLGVAGALIAVAGAIALLARGLQRMPRLGASNPEMPLAIVHRIAIGPRQGIALLRAFDRLMVVSIADSGTRLIAELDDPTLLARLQATPAPAAMLAQKLREAFSRGSRSGAAVLVAGVALTLPRASA